MLIYLQSKHATQILAIKHAVIAMCVCGEISYLVIAYEIGLDSNLREMGLAQVIYIYYTPYMEFRNMSGRAIHILYMYIGALSPIIETWVKYIL
jgi:hypothetical protein